MEQETRTLRNNPLRLMRLGGVIFLGVGLLFFVLGLVFFLTEQKKTATYVETTGVITDFNRDGYPYVAYEANGRTYEQRSNYTSSSMRVGDEIAVRYDPQSPNRMEAGGAIVWLMPILFMGMGGLFIVIGVFWLWFFRDRREPENPWAGPQT